MRIALRYYHIHEASISKSMSRSGDGARGRAQTRDAWVPGGDLEGCQCQGPRSGRGRQRNQFAVTWDTRPATAPVCFETILMVAERIKQADWRAGDRRTCDSKRARTCYRCNRRMLMSATVMINFVTSECTKNLWQSYCKKMYTL